MKKIICGLLAGFLLIGPAFAADTSVPNMTAGGAVADTDLFYCAQSSGTTDRKCTGAQVKTYSQTSAVRATTTTSEALANSDQGKLVTFSNSSAVACTIAQAGSGGNFAAGWVASLKNLGAGTVTCTPATSTVDGAATFTLTTGQGVDLYSDGTNYFTQPGAARLAALSGLGTGVATAAGNALSAAGGLTTTIGSGTAALGTSAISSGACATVVTVATSNVATTDVISFTPNADITAVTGYAPVTTGGLAIYPYPTSGNVNFKVCNPTSSSITPGAVTLNFRVTR